MLKVNFKKHKQNISYMPELNMQIKPFMFTKVQFKQNKACHMLSTLIDLCKCLPGKVSSPVLCFKPLKETFISAPTGRVSNLDTLSLSHHQRHSRLFIAQIFFARITLAGGLLKIISFGIHHDVYKKREVMKN